MMIKKKEVIIIVSVAVSLSIVNLMYAFMYINTVSAATNAMGNVNYIMPPPGCVYAAEYTAAGNPPDNIVNLIDGMYLARAFGSNPSWPHGICWMCYNIDADFDQDGWVWVLDLFTFGKNYGTVGD